MNGIVSGKVALVTGAASGIGRATALIFAREGARVACADRDEGGALETVERVRKQGGEASAYAVDVASEEQVRALVERTVADFGCVDCAHNNAGISGAPGPVQDIALEEWSRVIAINLTGVFLCMKYEIAQMRAQGGGAIVNTSSGAGVIGAPGLAHYTASKHGVLGLTKTAALENARTGIRVNAVCPGAVDTPMLQASMAGSDEVRQLVLRSQPGGELGTPEQIAEAVVWLCSERAAFVNGHSLLVDGASVAR